MKKLLKILMAVLGAAIILAAAAFFTLKTKYPPEKLKQMAQDYVVQNFNRQIRFEKISFNWIGFTLTDFALSEESSFNEGTFLEAQALTAKIAVKPLLKKQIRIDALELDGLTVQLIKRADGSFNFDSLSATDTEPAAETETTTPKTETEKPLVLTANQIKASHCNLSYTDEQTRAVSAVKDLNIVLNQLDLNNPFTAHIDFTTQLSQQGQDDIDIPVTMELTTALANFDLDKAYLQINSLTADYKTARFALQGRVDDFNAPRVELSGTLNGMDYTLLTAFLPDLPPFSLPQLNVTTKIETDLANASAVIRDFSLNVQNSFLQLNGTTAWGGETASYDLNGSAQVNLAEAVNMAGTGGEFKPQGVLASAFRATDKNDGTDINGTLTFKNASVVYDVFTLTDLNGTVTLAGLNNISSKSLTGKLNDGNFKSSFTYKNAKNAMDIFLNLNLEKLTLEKFPSSGEEENTQTANSDDIASAEQAATPTEPETFIHLNGNITIGNIHIPYFRSDGLTLNAALQNISQSMKKSNGTLSFDLQQGAITNLNSFVDQNKLVKIILLPLTIVRKVSGALKLNLFQTGELEIALSQGKGSYTFTDGVMTVDETFFNTTVSNISAAGNVNFVQDTVNMKATATLLTDAVPMVIKISGTPSDPKGKLDVVNTLGSVVGGILTGKSEKAVAKEGTEAASNTVRDTVTDTAKAIKQIGGLFKKK